MDWLLLPIDTSRLHDIDALTSWHARLMVLAWAVLFPLGVLVARYGKILPGQGWPARRDSRVWWIFHLVAQCSGGVLVAVAVVLVLLRPDRSALWLNHHMLGWVAVALCTVQFLAGAFRGSKGGPTDTRGSMFGDHYNMTLRRRTFEYLHKVSGYVALFIACLTIVTGLWLVNAPIWMWLLPGLWWIVLIIAFVVLQRRGMAVDTYQAIWGPDETHPGNRMKPIGWGIRRRW